MDTNRQYHMSILPPMMYKFQLTLDETVKLVHRMKSEMNMVREHKLDGDQLNLKRVFGELTPQLVKISDKGFGYRISINERSVMISHWDKNKHGLRQWSVHIKTTENTLMDCTVQHEPGQRQHLLKFIPSLENKMNEYHGFAGGTVNFYDIMTDDMKTEG